jgi:hypothetical protein
MPKSRGPRTTKADGGIGGAGGMGGVSGSGGRGRWPRGHCRGWTGRRKKSGINEIKYLQKSSVYVIMPRVRGAGVFSTGSKGCGRGRLGKIACRNLALVDPLCGSNRHVWSMRQLVRHRRACRTVCRDPGSRKLLVDSCLSQIHDNPCEKNATNLKVVSRKAEHRQAAGSAQAMRDWPRRRGLFDPEARFD